MKPITILLCAWVLWGSGFDGGKMMTLVLGAWEFRADCEAQQRIKAAAQSDTRVYFTCLPDTVDPRGR